MEEEPRVSGEMARWRRTRAESGMNRGASCADGERAASTKSLKKERAWHDGETARRLQRLEHRKANEGGEVGRSPVMRGLADHERDLGTP